MPATIEVKKLSKHFGHIRAVDNVSFKTDKGEIIGILGPNGAGKSTLMNMLTGYLSPSDGTIKVLGKDIKDNALFAKENIGFLPEGSPLYPDLTVTQFLRYMADLRGVKDLNSIIELSKIEDVKDQKIETLSKGYLRRVGFAQSILSNPPILILDEPTDGLDPNQKQYILEFIKKISKNKTILISTHLLDEVEDICTRIIIFNHGKILADGTLPNVLKETKSKTLENAFRKLTHE